SYVGISNSAFLRIVGRTESARPNQTIADDLAEKGWVLEYAEMAAVNPQAISQQRALLRRASTHHFLVVTRGGSNPAAGSSLAFDGTVYGSGSETLAIQANS